MFESDDFDQVLSQFDFPELDIVKSDKKDLNISPFAHEPQSIRVLEKNKLDAVAILPYSTSSSQDAIDNDKQTVKSPDKNNIQSNKAGKENEDRESKSGTFVLPKHTKRKIIDSYFDHRSKRKFPGPAGLLTGALDQSKDESICQIELLSQDVDFTQHNLRRDLFDSPIWSRLLCDTQSWNLDIDSVKTIKEQALSGNLRQKKAQNVTAFVEAVDRSAIDPLIILRDVTGSIKCTLHRDAWSTFSSYILSDYCALILQKPTVLTTGGAFKKHYLNITLSNILAIYSSSVLNEDGNKTLPDGYSIVYEEEFTVIKTEKSPESLGTLLEQSNGAEDLDGLDSFFSDDLF